MKSASTTSPINKVCVPTSMLSITFASIYPRAYSSTIGAPVTPILYFTFSNLSMSLPERNPNKPMNLKGASVDSIETENTPLFFMYSYVKFSLFILIAILAGLEVI